MYKQVSILALALISLCIGVASAMNVGITMNSGATKFTDSMTFGTNSFSQNTGVDFSKTIGTGSDPHAGFCHGWTSDGSNGPITGQAAYSLGPGGIQAQSLFDQGSATATMQFKDTGANMQFVQGLQTGNNMYYAWTNAVYTNYGDTTANAYTNWQYQNAQVINGITMDRTTGVMDLQFYIASPIVTPLTRPVFA